MSRPYQQNPAAKMWLWIGVSVIGVIILILWLWATSISLSSFNWNKTPEKKLIEKSQNDWNTLFNNEETKIKTEQMKLQLKNFLNAMATQSNSSTTSSTTNISTSNTSTINTSTQ